MMLFDPSLHPCHTLSFFSNQLFRLGKSKNSTWIMQKCDHQTTSDIFCKWFKYGQKQLSYFHPHVCILAMFWSLKKPHSSF